MFNVEIKLKAAAGAGSPPAPSRRVSTRSLSGSGCLVVSTIKTTGPRSWFTKMDLPLTGDGRVEQLRPPASSR
jgi:hypothetical protein